jgi:hypothetical protein
VSIYNPTDAEIERTFARALAAMPHAAKRLEAARLYFDGALPLYLTYVSGAWHVMSQRDQVTYMVTHHTCTCPDWQTHGAHLAEPNRYYCKHLLAYHAYRRILADELNRRILGDWNYTYDRNTCALHPGSLIIVRPGYGTPASVGYFRTRYARGAANVCAVRPVNPDTPPGEQCDWQPATAADYAALAEWLGEYPEFVRPKPQSELDAASDCDFVHSSVRSMWRPDPAYI